MFSDTRSSNRPGTSGGGSGNSTPSSGKGSNTGRPNTGNSICNSISNSNSNSNPATGRQGGPNSSRLYAVSEESPVTPTNAAKDRLIERGSPNRKDTLALLSSRSNPNSPDRRTASTINNYISTMSSNLENMNLKKSPAKSPVSESLLERLKLNSKEREEKIRQAAGIMSGNSMPSRPEVSGGELAVVREESLERDSGDTNSKGSSKVQEGSDSPDKGSQKSKDSNGRDPNTNATIDTPMDRTNSLKIESVSEGRDGDDGITRTRSKPPIVPKLENFPGTEPSVSSSQKKEKQRKSSNHEPQQDEISTPAAPTFLQKPDPFNSSLKKIDLAPLGSISRTESGGNYPGQLEPLKKTRSKSRTRERSSSGAGDNMTYPNSNQQYSNQQYTSKPGQQQQAVYDLSSSGNFDPHEVSTNLENDSSRTSSKSVSTATNGGRESGNVQFPGTDRSNIETPTFYRGGEYLVIE